MAITNTLEYCEELDQMHSQFPQIHIRAIIGRAYYHAFYEFRDHLENRLQWPITDLKGGSHLRLYSRLSGYPQGLKTPEEVLIIEEIKNRITSLKKNRTAADYKINMIISKKIQDYVVEEAKILSEEIAMI